jgi:16S rRNA (cytosine967-C5)-methyltransferase
MLLLLCFGGCSGLAVSARRSTSSRSVAHEVLLRCARDGAFAGRVLDSALQRVDLSASDAGLATQLVYGVLRNERLLDFSLGQLAPRLDKVDDSTLAALRIGAFEMLELRTADHAAVDQAVSLERRPHVRKFVNGVLRNLARRRDAGTLAPPEAALPPLAALAVRHSLPEWLLSKLEAPLGAAGVAEWAAANQPPPPLALRVNTRRATAANVSLSLSATGADVQPVPGMPDALYVRGAGSVTSLPGFSEGLWTVQDPAAQLVGHLARPPVGGFVLELCAAPGGKTAHLAEMMGDCGRLVALDVPGKVGLVRSSADRMGLTCVAAVGGDGTDAHALHALLRQQAAEFSTGGAQPGRQAGLTGTAGAGSPPDMPALSQSDPNTLSEDGGLGAPDAALADAVVCDAPCSGLGTLRRNPELRGTTAERLVELCALQAALLDAASTCVRPGGSLTYSTCSPLREEGEGAVAAFLARETGRHFSCEPIVLDHPILEPYVCDAPELGGSRRCIRSWTHTHGCDSFFAARLTRAAHS